MVVHLRAREISGADARFSIEPMAVVSNASSRGCGDVHSGERTMMVFLVGVVAIVVGFLVLFSPAVSTAKGSYIRLILAGLCIWFGVQMIRAALAERRAKQRP